MAVISIIGAGYVGLVTAAGLAELGHDVTAVEVDAARLSALSRGRTPIFEPGLDALVARNIGAGRLRFTGDIAEAVGTSALVFICVQTPSEADGRADVTHVFEAMRSIVAAATGRTTVVVKSTVPVGTGDALERMAVGSARHPMHVVSNPEFLQQGSAVENFFRPDRVVVGATPPSSGHPVAELYRVLEAPVLLVGRRSAELAKYAANAMLAARVSFINEVAAISEAAGAEIVEIAQVMGADPRIGPAFLRAGLGWGGSCFPKDVAALGAIAAGHGIPTPVLRSVADVNARQRETAFARLRDAVRGRPSPTVGVLGLAFKPRTDDLRGSPALDIIARLAEDGIHVRAHDPQAMGAAQRVLPNIHYAADPYDAAVGADALLLATEWPEYLALDWTRIATLMRGDVVLDGRNALDPVSLRSLGFRYIGFGRATDADGSVLDGSRGHALSGNGRSHARVADGSVASSPEHSARPAAHFVHDRRQIDGVTG